MRQSTRMRTWASPRPDYRARLSFALLLRCMLVLWLLMMVAAELIPGTAAYAQFRKVVSHAPSVGDIPVVLGDSLVVFDSDAQSPIFIEETRLSPNHNDQAREMIYSQMLADHPNCIFTLGDMASLGFLTSTWKSFDDFLDRARTEGVPVFPTIGNHEVMIYPSYGVEEFYSRFPWYRKTGYSIRVGKLAVAMLNSNYNLLSTEEQARQSGWLDSTLAAFEADTSVSIVFVACHHSPYTNSTIVSPAEGVREDLVPIYLRYPKCRLFLSGHCHAFEHFRQEGKDFFVIGGGGGLQQPLLTGSEARWEDLFPKKTEKRMFHYLRCRIMARSLEVTVRMIKEDFTGFEDVYQLSFPLVQLTPQ